MNLTLEEISEIIKVLDARRIYFESRNVAQANKISLIISKLGNLYYK